MKGTKMDNAAIRQQLHNYLEVADDKKLKAIYVMVEAEIKEKAIPFTAEEKKELDSRVDYYHNGGKMITPAQMQKRLAAIRKQAKK